jgi:aminobenzoyl-glutamate utilization protein B
MLNEEQIWKLVDAKKAEFIALSDRVFETPETLYNEFASVAEHVATLKAEGFVVTEGVCGMPTAVMGEAGTEGPVIAILGEFDALPQLSQAPGVAKHSPIEMGGNGHGCGHNLLGAASLLAATSVKDWLAKNGIAARVRYYGCPAEEGGAAKAYMARDGLLMMLMRRFLGTPQPLTLSSMAIRLPIRVLISLFMARRRMQRRPHILAEARLMPAS